MSHNNNNHNRAFDQAPPKKKRKRLFTDYSDYLQIITNLGDRYDPLLVQCIKYTNREGLSCDTCKQDKRLSGYWTTKPIAQYNYSKVRLHIFSAKHKSRMSNEEKAVHPDFVQNNNQAAQPTIGMPSQLDKIIKGIELILTVIKEGCALSKVKPFNGIMGPSLIEPQLSSAYATDQIINAMNIHQLEIDRVDILGVEGQNMFSLALDGSSQSIRSVKIFDFRGCKSAVGPITKYCVCMDAKKSIADLDIDLSDLFSTDSGVDNKRLIEKVVMEHLKVEDWSQLVQLCVDGAGQNMGRNNGCVELVRCTFLHSD